MVARGRFELPSMGLFLVLESKAHHWPGHRFRPLLVHYTTGLQETRVFGQDPISLLRQSNQQLGSVVHPWPDGCEIFNIFSDLLVLDQNSDSCYVTSSASLSGKNSVFHQR